MDAVAAAAAAAANQDDPPPVQDGEEEQSPYDSVLEVLSSNKFKSFALRELETIMTISQAKGVSKALKQNTSIQEFVADLEFCPPSATGIFADYIKSSTKLKTVTVDYFPKPSDHKETRKFYKTALDTIFHSVKDNPSIKKFVVNSFGNPESVYSLLANSKSLQTFCCATRRTVSPDVAFSIATGMSQNSCIKTLELCLKCGPELGMILSGLGASAVETLNILTKALNVNFHDSVSKVLSFVPSLKKLQIEDETRSYSGVSLGNIFIKLSHPSCKGLTHLFLKGVSLASSVEANPLDAVPIEKANVNVQCLHLDYARFDSPQNVCLLWNLVGLQELSIITPAYVIPFNGNDESHLDYWAKLVRRNKDLTKVCISYESDYTFLNGVLDGALKHKSLTHVKIEKLADIDTIPPLGQDAGLRLCRVLQEPASSLQTLYFQEIRLELACVTLLVAGLCDNQSLKSLRFFKCTMEARAVIEILESLLVNHALEDLAFDGLEMTRSNDMPFHRTLLQVFQENDSLARLVISNIDLRSGALAECLSGLDGNKTLKTLDFDECRLDNAGMACLVRTLQSTNIGLDEIGLPVHNDDEEAADEILEGRLAFLRGLVHMPTIRKVHFGLALTQLDDESHALVLRAVKENKKIHIFDDFYNDGDDDDDDDDDDDSSATYTFENGTVVREIVHYLKLNGYGRHLLDSPNMTPGFWPRILSPIASKLEDSDALFFFLREYFSRQCKLPVGDETLNQEQPLQKRARLA